MKSSAKQIVVTLLTTAVMIGYFCGVRYFSETKEVKTIKVGFIYEGDESTTYNQNFIDAKTVIEDTYGDAVETFPFYNVAEERLDELYDSLMALNCDIIFSCSYGYEQTVKQWAKLHPDIQFCQAAGDNANEGDVLDNYHCYMGTIYQGRYVAGAVAGKKMRELIDTGVIAESQAKIGYVAAFPCAEVISGYTAFFMGARSQVPNVTMEVVYTDTWSQYSLEKKVAEKLIRNGCVVISQHSDTIGPAAVCEELSGEYTVFHVGYNGSMTEIAPTTSLISCKINWTPYQVAAVGAVLEDREIEDVVDAHANGRDCWAGFDKGWVEILDINEIIAAEGTRELVQRLTRELDNGKIQAFSGDYTGTDPFDASDTIDLSRMPYHENESASAPAFHYVLDDVITVLPKE